MIESQAPESESHEDISDIELEDLGDNSIVTHTVTFKCIKANHDTHH